MVLGILERRKNVHWSPVSSPSQYGQISDVSNREGVLADSFSLAMAEMTVIVAALYRKYRTSITDDMQSASPGITSRFEVFHDVSLPEIKVK